jgi:hypothetical protein
MADRQDGSEIMAVIIAAIEKHARGDVERLARGIMVELFRAGFEIRANEGSRCPRKSPGAAEFVSSP